MGRGMKEGVVAAAIVNDGAVPGGEDVAARDEVAGPLDIVAIRNHAGFAASAACEPGPPAGDTRARPEPAPIPAAAGRARARPGAPLPLISIDGRGKCHLEERAVSVLNKINGKLAIVGIAGVYRSGKSFLLNRLLGQQCGFDVGHTVNPCTKGLWMWDTPVKLDEDYHCIFIDTEGLGSCQRTASCDTQIFSLCVLLSSCFIFNSMGPIDEQALDELHLVVHLAQHLHAKAEGTSGAGADRRLHEYLPSLLWVLRDFHLELRDEAGRDISASEYLEEVLEPITGQSEKCELRAVIRDLFRDRDCITLVRPIDEEGNLKRLQELPYASLRPPFRRGLDAFVGRVHGMLRPKLIEGAIVSGAMLAALASEYCKAINNSALPTIHSAWSSVVQQQLRASLRDAVAAYRSQMDDRAAANFPMGEEQLRGEHQAAKAEAVRVFLVPRFDGEDPKFREARTELTRRMGQHFESLASSNMAASLRQCTLVATALYQELIGQKLSTPGHYTSLDDLYADWGKLRERYAVEAVGPAGAEVLSKFLLQRMTESTQRVSESLRTEMSEHPEMEIEIGGSTAAYRGQWMGEHRHGQGTLTKPDGQQYRGTFVASQMHGHGVFRSADGSVYEGQWDQGRAHGYGKLATKDRCAYEGEWQHNQKSGRGAERWPDGSSYEGEFLRGAKHGSGKYVTAGGAQYEGQFTLDCMDGAGCYAYGDGSMYTGQLRQGQMCGRGRMEWPDGSAYEGGYDKDMKHGVGTLAWPDGRVYRGQWCRGKQEGGGAYTDRLGFEIHGSWRDGEQVSGEVVSGPQISFPDGNYDHKRPLKAVPPPAATDLEVLEEPPLDGDPECGCTCQ